MSAERPDDARQTFAARASSYDAESPWVGAQALIDPLFAGMNPGQTLLDVCSGTGTVGSRAESLGLNVVGYDLSFDMLRVSPLRARVVGTGSSLPFDDRSFDRVICRQGLHYLDLDRSLAEFGRVARQGVGIGTITMWDESDRPFWNQYFSQASPGRLVVFAPGDMEQLLSKAGLTVQSSIVENSRGPVLGPVRHLPEEVQASILAGFLAPTVALRHEVVEVDGEYTYLMRWEFVIAGVDT